MSSEKIETSIHEGDCYDIPAGEYDSLSYFVSIADEDVKDGSYSIKLTVTVISAESGRKHSESKWVSVAVKYGSRCFIATACYGSPLAEEINVLRQFRDNVLLKDDLGRAFVDFYYSASPPVAAVIEQNEVLRYVVRYGFIEPLVFMIRAARPVWDG